MRASKASHSEKGVVRLLARPWVFKLFTSIVRKKGVRKRLVEKHIERFPNCRILDIGCGTAEIVSSLPDSVGEYVGFDMNPRYISFAKKQWKGKTNCRFFCQKVEDAVTLEPGSYDIVLALGVIHHLNDDEAFGLFDIAHKVLRSGGVLITYDNVFVENQHWFAKWLISQDRGKAVRTVEGYKRLAARYFADIEGQVLHDALRVPYTVFIMKCGKGTSAK
ncbi:MAG: class I SAM-dependent methyltransferase [Planctomycetota bacterium]|jgi:2-polyprenyl-3-methyl-5-hydroxy-6-metoxy-1,4-benzoquinol methylase